MTIINGIEIDIDKLSINEIKLAIYNNEKIDNKLHVITVISNPCQYARRYILAREFIKRMENEKDIILYVVELAYNNQKFYVTEENNKNHLQLRTDTPLWHKENMINIGVAKLLPKNWKAMAWIDSDIEFENINWASDVLKILNGSKDIVQLFSHCIDMDKDTNAMSIFPSFCYQFCKNHTYGGIGINMWHPGYGWACNRKTFERMGGLYEFGILGSGDHCMAFSFINNSLKCVNVDVSNDYKQSIKDFENKSKNLRLGYVPGIILHYYHGSKKNRQYSERWKILVKHNYSPLKHITKNSDGLLIPSESCPKELLSDILQYFFERNEDDMYLF